MLGVTILQSHLGNSCELKSAPNPHWKVLQAGVMLRIYTALQQLCELKIYLYVPNTLLQVSESALSSSQVIQVKE